MTSWQKQFRSSSQSCLEIIVVASDLGRNNQDLSCLGIIIVVASDLGGTTVVVAFSDLDGNNQEPG